MLRVRGAMKRLNAQLESGRDLTAAIVLHEQKRGRDEFPNPLSLLTPLRGLKSNLYQHSNA